MPFHHIPSKSPDFLIQQERAWPHGAERMGTERILRVQMALHSCKIVSENHLAAKEGVLMEILKTISS